MASNVAPIERLQERPIAVDPEQIERAFAELWQETSVPGADESTIRLRVVNLVALARDESATDRFEALMQILPESHPCRGILTVATATRTTLTASVSAHCWRSPGNRRHVCSEEVLLYGGNEQGVELASSVLALLVPELPVVVWFMDAPQIDDYLAQAVLQAADRVFFDSALAANPAQAYRDALAMKETYDVEVIDLAWLRTETWRTLAAQCFDGGDGPRELSRVREIEVLASGGAGETMALLVAAWLASRIGLSLADVSRSGTSLSATMYSGTRGVQVRVAPAASGDSAIEGLTITTDDAEFSLQCHQESAHIHVRENWDGGSSRRTVEQPRDDTAVLLTATLDGAPGGRIFDDTLRMGLQLLGD